MILLEDMEESAYPFQKKCFKVFVSPAMKGTCPRRAKALLKKGSERCKKQRGLSLWVASCSLVASLGHGVAVGSI